MFRLSVALLLAMACTPSEDVALPSFDDAALVDAASDLRPPPVQTLTLEVTPVIPGQTTDFRVTGLNPNENVFLGRGQGGLGGGPCLATAGGLCLDIGNPVFLIGRFRADANGVLELSLPIPSTVPLGATAAFQAVAIRGSGGDDSSKSNAVLRTATSGTLGAADLVQGDILITEIMQNPDAVSDTNGEWFEVFNASGLDIDLDGIEFSDDGSNSFTVQASVVLAPEQYAVFARNSDASTNGGLPVDYAYANMSLGNGDDELIASFDGLVLDEVRWDGGPSFPDPAGASMSLSDDAFEDNSAGGAWCEGVSPYGSGDRGTPGAANPVCDQVTTPTCDDGILNGGETGVDCGGTCDDCPVGSFARDEDFEDFANTPFDFQYSGTSPWELSSSNCRSGSCLRTSPSHLPETVSSTSVALSVREDTTVGFWVKHNTEPNEHIFRFLIDGVEQVALSGQADWTYYSFPVTATGPNGSDRVLTWEYDRSAFFDPTHPPYNEVYIDDIEMPDWNTAPTVPTFLTPSSSGADATPPTFSWTSSDPDLDPITYELQVDSDPDFGNPVSTGETYGTAAQLPMTDGLWYFRARSKDDSDYRWSAWTPVGIFELDSTLSGPAWQQMAQEQLAYSDSSNPRLEAGRYVATDESTTFFSDETPGVAQTCSGCTNMTTLDVPADVPPGTDGILVVTTYSSYIYNSHWYSVGFDNVDVIPQFYPGEYRSCYGTREQAPVVVPDVARFTGDGVIDVAFTQNFSGCGVTTPNMRARLEFNYFGGRPGAVVSPVIDHDAAFGGGRFWDKITWSGSGDVVIRVVGPDGILISDSVLPGNAAGFSDSTIPLYGLDPAQYPSIQIEADMGFHSTLDWWKVTGGDSIEWTFDVDGEAEGWAAVDTVPASLSVANGLLTLQGTAAGTDPRIEHLWAPPVNGQDFSTLELRLRTSNNYNYDDVRLSWQSDFGLFDERRSFTINDFFFDWVTLTYDLTETPMSPNEPFTGQIEGLRIDPVDRFLDQLQQPADGTAEIAYIRLY